VEEVDRMAVKKIAHPNVDERIAKDAVRSGRLTALRAAKDRRPTMANWR
jgi:hypothetical protein